MKILKKIIKNGIIRLKYYKLGKKKQGENTLVFFMEEGYPQPHPGLVDRLKAIVGLYYIAKENGFSFRLKYTTPFCLEEYLEPADYNWLAEEIVFEYKNTKLIQYNGEQNLPVFDENVLQYHCYYYEGLNILRANHIENWEEKWHQLFHELFTPSTYLKGLLEMVEKPERYVAIHTRFVNALDNFEEGYESNLTEEEKKQLIARCLKGIEKIIENEKKDVLIFSDSSRFLHEAKIAGYPILSEDDIGHISFQADQSVHDKTFIDFFTMANSEKVYALRGKQLYNSVFSQYAAIVGEKEYEIIEV